MADLTTGNINTEAQTAASVADGDYIYIYKADAGVFSKIEKSLLLQGAGGSGSGISAEVYEAIKTNVNLVQARLDKLIADLANLAFTSTSTQGYKTPLGQLAWPEGTEPTQSPSLSIKYNGSTVSSVNVTADTSGTTAISFVVKAANLTSSNAFAVSLSGTGAEDCTLSTSSITAAQATSGATVTVTYSGTSASSVALAVSGNSLNASVNINIAAAGSAATYYSVTLGSGSSNVTFADGETEHSNIESGNELTCVIEAGTGYALPSEITVVMGSTRLVQGTGYTYSSDTGRIYIAAVTGDVVITAVADAQGEATIWTYSSEQYCTISGYWNDTDGSRHSGSACAISPMIAVNNGAKYFRYQNSSIYHNALAFYTNNVETGASAYVAGEETWDLKNNEIATGEIPEGALYFRFSIRRGNDNPTATVMLSTEPFE